MLGDAAMIMLAWCLPLDTILSVLVLDRNRADNLSKSLELGLYDLGRTFSVKLVIANLYLDAGGVHRSPFNWMASRVTDNFCFVNGAQMIYLEKFMPLGTMGA